MKSEEFVQSISQTASALGNLWLGVFGNRADEPFDERATQMFEQFADQMQCMIYRCDVSPLGHTRVTYTNRAVEWIYELTRNQIADDASPILSLVHPDDHGRIWKSLSHSHFTGDPWHEQYRVILPKKGTCWREARATVSRLHDGRTIWHGFIWDITAEKNAEQAKDQFFAIMGHDLRTPITGVLGCTEILKGTSLEASQFDLVEMIEASGNHLLLLVNDLLDLSKIQAGRLELDSIPFSPGDCCRSACKFVQPQASLASIKIETDLSNLDGLKVRGDPLRFTQIVTNLVANALKHGAKKHVRITAKSSQNQTERRVHCCIRVEDDGEGIPAEKRQTIFEAYTQLNRQSRQSSGLGLALASQLALQMDGTITVDDSQLGGANFEFHSVLPS